MILEQEQFFFEGVQQIAELFAFFKFRTPHIKGVFGVLAKVKCKVFLWKFFTMLKTHLIHRGTYAQKFF